MRLLIACHCKNPFVDDKGVMRHHPLTFQSSIIPPDSVEISYIDPDCKEYGDPLQYKDWSEIPDKHFDFIWFEYCPIFGNPRKGHEIIQDAVAKLDNSGKLFIGLNNYSDSTPMKHLEYLERIFTKIGAVEHELIPKVDLPFYIAKDYTEKMLYVVLSKKTVGGKHRGRRSIRNKRRGNITKKQTRT
jgi:hypothetical protein